MQNTFTSYGFSLIELMIVVSIIGILAMIAIPSYQSYTQRARFAEVISTANIFKTAITIAIQSGVPIHDLAPGKHGIPQVLDGTKNLASVQVNNGIIIATATKLAQSATYILTPLNDASTWEVSGTCLASGLCHE